MTNVEINDHFLKVLKDDMMIIPSGAEKMLIQMAINHTLLVLKFSEDEGSK